MDIQSLFYEPNAFYFPWNITLDGMNSLTTDIRINKFLNKVYPGFLQDENKLAILHTIVKRLY